jgi:hypothetical protein
MKDGLTVVEIDVEKSEELIYLSNWISESFFWRKI